MRKFLFIISVLTIVFIAGCSEKTETNKPVQKEKIETVKINKEYYSNLSQEELNNKLLIFCEKGNLEEVKELLKAGADVNSVYTPPNHCGGASGCTPPVSQTPLLIACGAGHIEIVKELISAGANVNKGNSHKETPLMFASKNGHNEIVKILISAGANVNAISDPFSSSWGFMSYTALYFANTNGHSQVVKTLLKAGAQGNILGGYRENRELSAAEKNEY